MNDLIVSKTVINTGICNGNIGTNIDLDQFFKKLEINEEIIGVKYHGKIRGKMTGNGSFFNQITLIVYSKETNKQVNVKIFGDGSLQFSGIKTIKHAECSMKIILSQLISIKGEDQTMVKIVDGIVYDNNDYAEFITKKVKNRFEIIKIYSYPVNESKIKLIGIKKCNDYVINNEKCVVEDEYFVSSKFDKLVKKIFTKSGEEIGYYTYKPEYKRKNVILKGRTITEETENNFIVTDKYNNISGRIVRTFFDNKKLVKKIPDGDLIVNCEYSCLNEEFKKNIHSFDDTIKNMGIYISNLNSKFKVSYNNSRFDKSVMHSIFLNKYNLDSYLNLESKYPGLSLKLYYNQEDELIKHNSTTTLKETRKVSAAIFNTGSIILSGCTTKKEIILAKSDIINMLSDNLDTIIKKAKMEVKIENDFLTIWDII